MADSMILLEERKEVTTFSLANHHHCNYRYNSYREAPGFETQEIKLKEKK